MAIKRLENFEALSSDDLKDIFIILENIKNVGEQSKVIQK